MTPRDGGRTRIIGSGTGEVDAGLVGNLDTTVLANGAYILELSATDAGNNTAVDTEVVYVDGAYKPGRFTVSFVDLQIPVAGLPITITRTYDSLKADQQGDFGYGWSMDLSNTRVQVLRAGSSDPLFGNEPFTDGTRVVVTLPDGTTEGFTFLPQNQSSGFVTSRYYYPKFVADVGVKSELIVDGVSIGKLGDGYILMDSGENYTPEAGGGTYELKLRNGNSLIIDPKTGDMLSIIDRSGNTLNFTGDGIFHDSGRGVRFDRDNGGRIITITDPAGNKLHYDYNQVTGDLISLHRPGRRQKPPSRITRTRSIPTTSWDEIRDPFGRSAARTEYDESGRVIRVTDADGKVIETD